MNEEYLDSHGYHRYQGVCGVGESDPDGNLAAVLSRLGTATGFLGRIRLSLVTAPPSLVIPMTGGSPRFANSYSPSHDRQLLTVRLKIGGMYQAICFLPAGMRL